MSFEKYEHHPFFKKLVRQIEKDEYLFRQGQRGNTMFIILHGTVQLIAERDGEDHVVALMEAGQFLGEKALVKETPYQRAFSARAMDQITVLELGLKEITIIQRESPELMLTILKRTFEISAERLDRANYLTRVLRSSDNTERLFECICYLCRVAGKKVPEGTRIPLTVDSIHYFIDMEKEEIQNWLARLVKENCIIPSGNAHYIIPDENRLFSLLENLRLRIAS